MDLEGAEQKRKEATEGNDLVELSLFDTSGVTNPPNIDNNSGLKKGEHGDSK